MEDAHAEAGLRRWLSVKADCVLLSVARRGFRVAGVTGAVGLAALNSGQMEMEELGHNLIGFSSALAAAAAISRAAVNRVFDGGAQVHLRWGIDLEQLLRGVAVVEVFSSLASISGLRTVSSVSRYLRLSSYAVAAAGFLTAIDPAREFAGADPGESSEIVKKDNHNGLLIALMPATYTHKIASVQDFQYMYGAWLDAAAQGLDIDVDVVPQMDYHTALDVMQSILETEDDQLIFLAQDCPLLRFLVSEALFLCDTDSPTGPIGIPRRRYVHKIKSVDDFRRMSLLWLGASRKCVYIDVDIVDTMTHQEASNVLRDIEEAEETDLFYLAQSCRNLMMKAELHRRDIDTSDDDEG